MWGVKVGDASGSWNELLEGASFRKGLKLPYEERIKILDKEVPLLDEKSTITDDSVFSYAVIVTLLNSGTYEENYRKYGIKELNIGFDKRGIPAFGSEVSKWLLENRIGEQKNSYGNGASMRVSPIGYFYDDIEKIKHEVRRSCEPTHNNEEAIECAEMVAIATHLSKKGYSQLDIKKYLLKNYNYKFDYDLDYLRKNHIFNTRSSITIPIALSVFFQSEDFEDGVRNAISIGGDTDTYASIVGALFESFRGIPEELYEEIQEYTPEYMKDDINKFYGICGGPKLIKK